MVGRIESYIHSDSVTQNKGAAVVKVECATDFAARTDGFKTFASKVAKLAYGANAETWPDVIAVFPDIETERESLAQSLRETVSVTGIVVLNL